MIATYRLQLSVDFGFAEAADLVPYLAELGVSHLYLSPITEARPGSTHGYDVVDHGKVREELGGEEGFEALRRRCVESGLGIVLDFVPNHAGIGRSNEAWQDVLAYASASPFVDIFDLDIHGGERILLPFLGRYYGEALEDGEISAVYEDGHLSAAYFDHRFRMGPDAYRWVLNRLLPGLGEDVERGSWARLLEDYRAAEAHERDRAERLRERMAELVAEDGAPVRPLLSALSPQEVHELLETQRWRLAFWQTAAAEINYRRFFDINDLAGLRMESPAVFEQTHAKLLELLGQPGVDGVRIDHVDGLYDPRGYLVRLRDSGVERVWVEKILGPREAVPASWPVAGTTGYEVLNDLLRVLVWGPGEGAMVRALQRWGGGMQPWEDTVHDAKRLVMKTSLAGEMSRLVDDLCEMAKSDYHTRDFTRLGLQFALEEIVAVLDRYRTYLPDDRQEAEDAVGRAVERAKARNPAFEPSVFDFVGRVVLGPVRAELQADRELWVGRFQQYTAPVAAKGVEDTSFYRDHRLCALCEVGGEPDRFATSARVFHSRMRHRAKLQPLGLTPTATHDHKRGADTRMRLAMLAELHRPWMKLARRLAELGRRHQSPVGPSATDAYLFHQLLVALHGSDEQASLTERLGAYMQKAAREAKRRTSWIRPDEPYEAALGRYVEGMIGDEQVREAVEPFAARVASGGFCNAIGQVVLQHCVAGVPDIYRGTELLDLSLVDPDNRRPVDFERRAGWLREMRPLLQTPDPLALQRWSQEQDPRLKLYVTARLLRLRREHPGLLGAGEHRGLEAPRPLVAFARVQREHTLIVSVRRFPTRELKAGGRVRLRGIRKGAYRDVLSGERVELGEELRMSERPLPWVVLASEGPR